MAAHLRVTHKREALDEIKRFLAKAGVLADEIRTNPETALSLGMAAVERYERMGKSPAWIRARVPKALSVRPGHGAPAA